MSTIWKPHVTVAVVVPRDGRYLLVEERVRGRLVLNQPAGHLEADESLVAAARREALEETGHEVEIRALVGIYRWRSPRTDQVILRFAFHAEAVAHHPELPLDEGIERALWLSREELVAADDRHRSRMVLRNVLDFERGRRFPLDLIHDLDPSVLGLEPTGGVG